MVKPEFCLKTGEIGATVAFIRQSKIGVPENEISKKWGYGQ